MLLTHGTERKIVYIGEDEVSGWHWYETPDGTGDIVLYYTSINIDSGEVECECKGFNMVKIPMSRRDGVEPKFDTPKYHCRHITQAIRDCIERGVITTND